MGVNTAYVSVAPYIPALDLDQSDLKTRLLHMGPDEARQHRKTEFGPPSQHIRPTYFGRDASDILSAITASVQDVNDGGVDGLSPLEDKNIEEELNLDGLKQETNRILENRALREVLDRKYREYASKRKEHDPEPPPLPEDPEISRLQTIIEECSLQHWPPPKQSIYYFRKNKKAEENGLSEVRPAVPSTSPPQSHDIPKFHENSSLITVSYYSRLLKSSNRNTTHAAGWALDAIYSFLSTQTLQDVYNQFPCSSKHLPKEIWVRHPSGKKVMTIEASVLPANDSQAQERQSASVIPQSSERSRKGHENGGMIIENTAYSVEGEDWARQMVDFVRNNPNKEKGGSTSTVTNVGLALRDIPLGDLQLRIQMPYWIIHKGNCQHCWVVEEIRLVHPHDLQKVAAYPLALHIARQSHPTCHHCGRNPATLAVNGDVRLGESPSRICELCWQLIGKEPKTVKATDIMVVPLHGTI